MAITVGTNSYLTLLEFKANADMLGLSYGSFDDAAIESSLARSALLYIDTRYTFKGYKVDEAQAMSLPTGEVAITDIAYAATYLAWQDLSGKLFVDLSAQVPGGKVLRERDKLATLETEVEYQQGTARVDYYDTTIADNLLKPYLREAIGGFKCIKRQS